MNILSKTIKVMWDFTEDDKRRVEEIYQHFLPLFPNIDKKLLYDRILSGYCYGENGLWLETIEDWENVFNKSKLPEPYKTYVDFDKYISEIVWVKIENEDGVAPNSGLYLFNCRGDNHTFMELYELKEGEKLCKYYLDHHFNGWAVVKPIEYHFVEDDEKELVINVLEIKDDRRNP